MLIDVLIPTFNRGEYLIKNLKKIQNQLDKNDYWDKVGIIVSDNCSTDNTQDLINEFLKTKDNRLSIQYFRNNKNLGLEPNALQVLSKSNANFVLFLGDDDFLDDNYLKYCYDCIIKHKNLGCIIPGIVSVFEDGTKKDIRGSSGECVLKPGFESMLDCSHWGHQMSGIVCRREGLLKDYYDQEEYRNPYLFLYFTANRLLKYTGVYNNQYKTEVNTFNVKDWGYNEVGLLDDVYKCYFYFETILGQEKVKKLILRFTVLHSYRLAFKSKNPLILFNQYRFLTKITTHLQGIKSDLRRFFIKDFLKALFS